MKSIRQQFQVPFQYDVHFTEDVFAPNNPLLSDLIHGGGDPPPHDVLMVVDSGLLDHHPDLLERAGRYLGKRPEIRLAHEPVVVPGGETAKNQPDLVDRIQEAVYDAGLCRHSYVLAIGGGSVIDLAGFAAATAHRGIRLIRIPTTVLSQNDSAVGVKNGINAFGAKNFLGAFAPPYGVINDSKFLRTLDDRDWRSGISEAVKVALLKDAAFFEELERDAHLLEPSVRNMRAMNRLIFQCAKLHLEHIATSGDPFEFGTSRPLDFGHWSAHQLEQLTGFELRHGEAVAIGIALDATYSRLSEWLDESSWNRVLTLFERLGFNLYVPELGRYADQPDHPESIFQGLEAFREHLGGELTIMLLNGIGSGVEVHQVEIDRYRKAISLLRDRSVPAKNVA